MLRVNPIQSNINFGQRMHVDAVIRKTATDEEKAMFKILAKEYAANKIDGKLKISIFQNNTAGTFNAIVKENGVKIGIIGNVLESVTPDKIILYLENKLASNLQNRLLADDLAKYPPKY